MTRMLVVALALALAVTANVSAQTRRTTPARPAARPAAKPAPPPPAVEKVAPDMKCPAMLGVGVTTKLSFCDVLTGREPEDGVLIALPPHTGPVTLTFNLHNRHTYSEEQVKSNRAFSRYTATIGVLTMDNHLISRAVVQSEFRNAGDLVDRIGGGAGPGGVKAVAPTGTEAVSITIPEEETAVSVLGEKMTADRIDGSATYSSPGRPVAVMSNVMIEYTPPPPPKPARRPAPRK